MTAFSIQNLTVVKGEKKILDSVSFDVQEGEFVCVVGPSGAGKSTLLRQLNRLDYGRIGGQILWNGKSLEEYDVHVLREQVAYIFQKAVMFPGSAEENIKMGAHNLNIMLPNRSLREGSLKLSKKRESRRKCCQ